jgi:hypothetical protein
MSKVLQQWMGCPPHIRANVRLPNGCAQVVDVGGRNGSGDHGQHLECMEKVHGVAAQSEEVLLNDFGAVWSDALDERLAAPRLSRVRWRDRQEAVLEKYGRPDGRQDGRLVSIDAQ